jgi:hypothetical protein
METGEGNLYATRFPDAATTPLRYDEGQHGGIQTLPDGGLRIVPTLESKPESGEARLTASKGAQRQRRRKHLIIGAAAAAVVVVAAIGAAVGGAVGEAARKAKTNPVPVSTAAQSRAPATATATATITATSPFTSATSLPSVYLGCYFDDSNRALREAYRTDPLMTPQLCNSFCQGFPFYAVEATTQCFCGTTFQNGYPKVPESECNNSCSGKGGAKCGGFWRLSLYSSTGASAPPAVNYTAQGCFTDQLNRGLTNVERLDNTMTPPLCAGFCAGYQYAGAEYGNQCFCGNAWPSSYSKVTDNECNFTCAGDPTQTCGGTWLLNLYVLG